MGGKDTVRVLGFGADCPRLDIIENDGSAVAGVWPGVGASMRSMHHVTLAAGGRTRPSRHPMEAVYYVKSGTGTVGDGVATAGALVEGSMVHIEAGSRYAFAAGPAGMELIGGPCPADPAIYSRMPT